MPKGSVRALLALFVVSASVSVVTVLALNGALGADVAASALIGLATLVLNAYFLTRKEGA